MSKTAASTVGTPHSKLPWEVLATPHRIGVVTTKGAKDAICVMSDWARAIDAPNAADAAYIVLAVNSYPALVDALRDANAFILAPAEDIKEGVLSRIRAALKLAGAP